LTSPELHAKLSKESAQVHIDHKTSEIHVSSKTSDALNEVSMTVFIYADVFMSKLLATVRVEVTPLNCMYSQTRAGVQNKMNLAFPTGDCKQVEIHSSNYKNAYLPKRSANNTFNMLSNTINHVPICTKTYTTAQQKVVINAINADNGQKVYSWLLILASMTPTPTKTHSMQASIG
jgi:hypothetical protein